MKPSLSRRANQGSVLIVALLLAAVIAISLGSYIQLNSNSLKLANRTFYQNAGLNLAETGIEEALWAFNQTTAGSTTAWDAPWTTSGAAAHAVFPGFSFNGNTSGSVKVYVDNYNPPPGNIQPIVVAQATITLPDNQGTIHKFVEVKIRRRSLFATGLVGKDFVEFNGNNATVDSWNSLRNDDGTLRASPVHYSDAVKHDRGSIGSVSVNSNNNVDNADVFGTAAVGGPSTDAIRVGPQGRVGPFGTAAGVKDPNSISTDFTANLDSPQAPTGGTVLASIGATLGAAGTTTSYRAPTITSNLTVYGDVTLVLTAAAGSSAISLSGNHDGITLASGAKLRIYTAGDIDLSGQGVLNPSSQAIDFQIYGTSTSSVPQDIKIAGNGALRGVVYAPNASISIHGNGDVMGSIVGKDITLTGNARFHYDESLAEFGGNNPYGVVRWRELVTATERTSGPAAHLSTF